MKKSVFVRALLTASLGMLMTSCASADHHAYGHYHDDYRYTGYEQSSYGDYGRVIDARPIYRQVAIEVPRESCGVETVVHEERRRGGDSFAGTVVGGLVGAAIGHELGNGRGAATAAGGLIGASIGNDAAGGGREVTYRDREVCRTRYTTEYEQRIVGYDVSYSYQGRVYQTRTDRHPGDRINLAVAVRPRD